MVEIPTATPYAIAHNHVVVPSNSGAAIPSVPHKRKVIALDHLTIFSESSSSIVLIKNVDMEELIQDLMKTKVPPPAYRCIQEFITKVCMSFYCVIHSFHVVPHSFLFLISLDFCFSNCSGLYSSKHQA